MKPEDFVHLHVHSHYSLLEALPSPKALAIRTKELGMNSIALTDNGAMYGAVEFYQACLENEIKPIIGLDAYIAQNKMTDKRARIDDRPYRLTLIAYNEQGYKNLMKISTAGFVEGFYYKPRVDHNFLSRHSEGLIALSGGVRGEIPSYISQDNHNRAKELISVYQGIFGKDNFFIELVHQPDSGEQVDLNDAMKKFAKENNLPLVATRNIHYLNPEDRDGYEAQLCIQKGRTLEEFRRTSTDDSDLSFGNPADIIEYFKDVPEACENTRKIADRIDFKMDLGNAYLPIFPLPEGQNDNSYLRELSLVGLKKRYGDNISAEIMERFEFEYEVITKMGYSSYFIIVQDFVNFAKNRGILVGPGRGSAAGSLISYALSITDLDPLKYGLLFERFLNPDRVSMPDVDMDFADSRRGEILAYVTEKYGADKVAGIITFGTMKPKAAVRDAARVLGLTFSEADVIAKAVPDPIQGRHTPLKIAREEQPELRDLLAHDQLARDVIDLAMKIEGNPRHTSQHACGFVIGDIPLVERSPVQSGQREDTAFIVQYSLNSAEAVGLVKMDFLGLSNLTVIQDCLDIIEAVRGEKVDIENVPLDDKETFELLGRGDTTGVFQLESDGMKRYIRDLKPTEFEDIVAMVSLYRPGPLSAGMVPQYINRKNGREKVIYDHPLMESVLKETYGVTVYQEQIMKISRVLAGFTAGQADTLRKAMGKKKRDVLEKMKADFIGGCEKNGVKSSIAEKVWHDWEGFADYAFNKSHAACYALISYRTAYLKAHYTSEFMAALMNADISLIDRITIEVEECKRLGIEVLAPDVNESYPGFAVQKATGNIRWGLSAIKNFGADAALLIQKERKANGQFKDLVDFLSRMDTKAVNKKNLEALIKAGALDRFDTRPTLYGNLDRILKFHKQIRKDQEQNQVSLFDLTPTISEQSLNLQAITDFDQSLLFAWEKEMLGLYVSTHPASLLTENIKKHLIPANNLANIEDGQIVKIGGIIADIKRILTKKDQKPMAFLRVDDWTDSLEIVIFPKIYSQYRDKLVDNMYAIIKGKVSRRERGEDTEISVLADELVVFHLNDIPQMEYKVSVDDFNPIKVDDNQPKIHGLFLRVRNNITPDLIAKLRAVLQKYPGTEPVYLLVISGNEEKRISTEYNFEKSARSLKELADLIGQDNIIFEH
jgi:DNA polymerase-3 subunit alpha